ncbi:hypothetical protein BP5796_06096 [Coleophoma crateriformis]|uniref:RTA1 domain protein n=1 Tax=Coleophoma crateriformis TaxID=565419 RepID=A0A3D8RWN1_9HELO|nr:hypothetical protein BP5796_06096 [Coleophoma crateriformis]
MENGQYVDGSLWFYAPNKVAPIIWALLFSGSCILHIYQCVHYKCWKVTGIFPWAALIFVAGYILREVGAFNYSDLKVYIASLVMLYAAPPIYELANYFILSRILYYEPYHSPIHPGRVMTTFAALSSVVEALNANGAAYTANTSLSESQQATGRALLKAALILQLVILCLFVLLAATFHNRCRRARLLPANLNDTLLTLYASSVLIGCRTIYRTVEYFSTAAIHFTPNFDPSTISPIIRYEWFFWVFEATLMILNSYLLNARHPMRYLPRNNKIYLARDGVTEVEGAGYEDKRPRWVTFLDPFDLVGMVKGRNMKDKFWETHEREMGEANLAAPTPAGERGQDVEAGTGKRV